MPSADAYLSLTARVSRVGVIGGVLFERHLRHGSRNEFAGSLDKNPEGEGRSPNGPTDEEAGQGLDVGVDLGLTKNGERYLVQCKHWRKRQVGVTVVRELNGVVSAQGAHGGFVVTG